MEVSDPDALDKLVESGDFSLWKSAVRRPGSNMSKLVPFPVTLGSLETRTDGKVTGRTGSLTAMPGVPRSLSARATETSRPNGEAQRW